MDLAGIWADVMGTVWGRLVVFVVVAVVVALVVTAVVSAVFRAVAKRRGLPERAVARLRRPFRWLVVTIAAWVSSGSVLSRAGTDWELFATWVDRTLHIAVIASAAWFVGSVVSLTVDVLLARYRTDVADNRVARRVRTQALVIRRVAVAAIVLIAIAAALLIFPAAQALGTSLLASAGVVSIIAGLAAQSTLGNVIAGMQIAFSGAVRVDDVVIADGEWGRIEEITLTYVVVHVWDDRRLVLPSTYFTTTPFENWTRTSSQLMQAVEFDLDWRVDPQAMREELHRVLDRTELWDHRVAVLQVTDATGGLVHVRVLLTAVDAPTLFDLRCFVREELVRFLQEQHPDALPQQRVLLSPAGEEHQGKGPRAGWSTDPDRGLFSGSREAVARGRDFTGPTPTSRG
ncbi:mechanosensitive ion channel family protein [Amnibacterium endophyticum]|uniref:Mechanosensitive ion channel family protein n=1 Tax=Amnibacterium endophyticum TaxID=2109337 RepID=A0ABW4L953_9MICO